MDGAAAEGGSDATPGTCVEEVCLPCAPFLSRFLASYNSIPYNSFLVLFLGLEKMLVNHYLFSQIIDNFGSMKPQH